MNWVLVGVLACVLFLVPKAMSLFYDAEEVDYSRTSRRFQMYSQFDKYRKATNTGWVGMVCAASPELTDYLTELADMDI